MAKRTWDFEVDGTSHRLKLEHGFISGRREIILDGEVIEQSSKLTHLLMDTGSVHTFAIGESEGTVVISTNGIIFTYTFYLDREQVEPLEEVQPSKLHQIGVITASLGAVLVLGFVFCYLIPMFIFVDESERSLREISITFVGMLSAVIAGLLTVGSLFAMLKSRRFTLSMRWILLGISIWLYLATMIFWGVDDNGNIGILAAMNRGAPDWLIVVPILSAISMMALAINPPGVSVLPFFLGIAFTTIPIMFFDYEDVSQIPGFELAFGGKSAFVFGLLYWMISTAFAMRRQHVPLNARFAQLYYLGSYRHYLSLYEFAQENRLEIAGPIPETNNEVILRGTWKSKEFGIHSGKDGLVILIASDVFYWPFILHNSLLKLPSDVTENAFQGTCQNARGKEIPFYYWSWNEDFPMESALKRLQGHITAAQPLLKGDVEFRAAGSNVYYHKHKLYRMPLMKDDIKPILDWLVSFSLRIEELGLWDELPEVEDEIEVEGEEKLTSRHSMR